MVKWGIKNLKARLGTTVLKVLSICTLLTLFIVGTNVKNEFRDGFLEPNNNYDYILTNSADNSKVGLNSLYYIGDTFDRISMSYYEYLKDKHSIERKVPILQADEYSGLPVVGTTKEFFKGMKLIDGKLFNSSKEIVVGESLANSRDLFIGSKIKITHKTKKTEGHVGEKVKDVDEGKPYEHEEEYTVVGILEGSGTVYDNLLYMDLEASQVLHPGTVIVEDNINTALVDTNPNRLTGILIKSGGTEGLRELNLLLENDPQIKLINVSDVDEGVESIKESVDELIPIAMSTSLVCIGVLLALLIFNTVGMYKDEIEVILELGANKLDIYKFVLVQNIIILGVSCLLSSILSYYLLQFINYMLSDWSVIIPKIKLNTYLGSFLVPNVIIILTTYSCVVQIYKQRAG